MKPVFLPPLVIYWEYFLIFAPRATVNLRDLGPIIDMTVLYSNGALPSAPHCTVSSQLHSSAPYPPCFSVLSPSSLLCISVVSAPRKTPTLFHYTVHFSILLFLCPCVGWKKKERESGWNWDWRWPLHIHTRNSSSKRRQPAVCGGAGGRAGLTEVVVAITAAEAEMEGSGTISSGSNPGLP